MTAVWSYSPPGQETKPPVVQWIVTFHSLLSVLHCTALLFRLAFSTSDDYSSMYHPAKPNLTKYDPLKRDVRPLWTRCLRHRLSTYCIYAYFSVFLKHIDQNTAYMCHSTQRSTVVTLMAAVYYLRCLASSNFYVIIKANLVGKAICEIYAIVKSAKISV